MHCRPVQVIRSLLSLNDHAPGPLETCAYKEDVLTAGFLSMETGLLIPTSGTFVVRMCFNEGDHNESECTPNSECLSHLSFSVHILA